MPELHWLTRDADLKSTEQVPYRLLEEVPSLSATSRDPQTENMLIQGDNLDALKALLPVYGGRVKCIYADPPYNSDNAFTHYDDNLEHSLWLAAMYPRFALSRDLLAENGAIFVSIDDREGHYLKVMLDEIFGRQNFVSTFVWQKVDSPNDNKPPIAPDHEFVLCYEKRRGAAGLRKLGDENVLLAYPNIGADGRRYRDRLLKKNGKESLRTDRESMWFPIEAPDGSEAWPIHDDGREARWALSKKGVKAAIDKGLIFWNRRERLGEEVWVPYKREFAPPNPSRPHPTILLDVKTSRQAKAHQKELLPDETQFDTVKPEELIERLLEICTGTGDLVLDPFLGTGTTAAVAAKMKRRFIGIERGDQLLTHAIPRLAKVIEGEGGGISESVGWEGGGGVRFFRLGKAIFGPEGEIDPSIKFPQLAAHVWFTETRTPRPHPRRGEARSPLLGIHEESAYYLLYNGILGDRHPHHGNVLTRAILAELPEHEGPRVIYGESCRLSPATLERLNITFKQTPYDVRAR